MALTPRCFLGANSGTTTASNFTVAYTGWVNAGLVSGTAPATGDIVVICMMGALASLTFSFSSGTGTYTFGNTGTSISSPTMTAAWAYRTVAASDTAPTFGISSATAIAWYALAVAPDSGDAGAFDTQSTVLVGSTAGTSFTPNPATAGGSGEVSLILNLSKESANGANAIAVTAPTGWTALSGNGFGGSSSAKSNRAQICYQTGVSGTVTPTAETIKAGTSGSVVNVAYHVLVKEAVVAAASSPVILQSPAYAVQRSVTW